MTNRRQIPYKSRGELRIQELPGNLSPRWNVFDPFSRQCFRVGWLEHALLLAFRQPTSLLNASESLGLTTSPGDQEAAWQAFQSLLGSGLIQIADNHPRQMQRLASRVSAPHVSQLAMRLQQLSAWLGKLLALFSIQIRGPNPARRLAVVAPRLDIFFGTRAVIAWLGVAMATLLLVLLQGGKLVGEFDSWSAVLQPATGGMFLGVFLFTRCIHELGHALVCTRHGIRCPDIGLFFFFGVPCLYCDVSESWLLPRRHERASVAAAGMYAELLVATAAAWIWLCTADGLIHAAAMKTMLVCSLGTAIVNLNPLLRFDGYYILADWLDEPNLRNRADRTILDTFRNCLGRQFSLPISRGRRTIYCVYSLSSFLFRVVLSSGLAIGVASVMADWNLPLVGWLLATGLLWTWWGGSLMRIGSTAVHLFRSRRGGMKLAWVGVTIWMLAMLPLPVRYHATGWLEPQQVQGIYAPEDAQLLVSHVDDGAHVQADQSLFKLSSDGLAVERSRAARELDSIRIGWQHARFRTVNPALPTASIPPPAWGSVGPLDQHVQQLANELERLDQRVLGLDLRSPATGVFRADRVQASTHEMSAAAANSLRAETKLPTWTDASQVGHGLSRGMRLGSVHGSTWQAVIPIDSQRWSLIQPGSHVKVRLHHLPGVVLSGEVVALQMLGEQREAWQLTTEIGVENASVQAYAALVTLTSSDVSATDFRPGNTLDAVFKGPPQSLFLLWVRWLRTEVGL